MASIPQVERQLYILSLLSENQKGFTIEEIMNSLRRVGIDVSKKTVQRDIDYITMNFFVYEEEKNGKTVYFASKYNAENIGFTISELISLHFAREVLQPYSSLDVGKTAVNIFDRLLASAPQIKQMYIDDLSKMVKVYTSGIVPEKDFNTEYLEIIKKAIALNRKLKLEYHSFNADEITQREFAPYLLEIQEGCWHVIGYCYLRNAIRDFRVSRIRSLFMSDEIFIRPKNFYDRYKKNRFHKLAGEKKIRLKLLFTGDAARFVKEYERSKAHLLYESDKGLVFERDTTMTPEIVKWVLGFGAEVEVLGPQELKDVIRQQVKKLSQIYLEKEYFL